MVLENDDYDDEVQDDSVADPEGADLAAQLFQMAQAKGVTLNDDDLMEEDYDEDDEEYGSHGGGDDDDDDDDDDQEPNIPQGAINAFLGYDTGDVGERLAGKVDLTDDQLYSEVKERVLDTAGGFVDMIRGPSDDDDDDVAGDGGTPKPYEPPTKVPDSGLTAGEVVLLVLDALKHNDVPQVNRGVEILFGYSSSGSQIKNEEDLTPAEYADFLKETEYKVLFEHGSVVSLWVMFFFPWVLALFLFVWCSCYFVLLDTIDTQQKRPLTRVIIPLMERRVSSRRDCRRGHNHWTLSLATLS
jgi:hypothetical protein